MPGTIISLDSYRRERTRAGARPPAEPPPPASPFRPDDGTPAPRLSARQRAHRRRMLAHLAPLRHR